MKSRGINRTCLIACSFALGSWLARPDGSSDLLTHLFFWMWVLCAGVLTLRAIKLMIEDFRLRRDLAVSEQRSQDFGSGRTARRTELDARGMNHAAHGSLLGLDEQGAPVWRPAKAPFALVEMPPGVGKTACLVIGSILHYAMLGHSVFVPDVKAELAVMLAEALRALGIEVWCINPSRRYAGLVGDVEVNLYQPMIDALYGEGDERKNATKYAADFAATHVPLGRDEKNPYFIHGSRRAHLLASVSNAVIDPARATPTDAYLLLADPAAFLKRCQQIETLRTTLKDDPVLEFLRVEARNMRDRAAKNEENFSSFLEGVTQKMLAFNPAGHLGGYGRNAIKNLADIRKRQIVVFVMTPIDQMRELADFVTLLNANVLAACKAHPDGHPLHIVGEEALNYRFDNLAGELEVLRQLRVTGDFYIQSFDGLVRQYGREAAASIESCADIRIYAGLNSYERARRVSEMLADETVQRQDASYGAEVSQINLSGREASRRLMTPDEVLAMEPGTGWLFVRGLRPTKLRLTHYGEVWPWTEWVGNSPITDTRLHGKTRVRIDYEALRRGGRA